MKEVSFSSRNLDQRCSMNYSSGDYFEMQAKQCKWLFNPFKSTAIEYLSWPPSSNVSNLEIDNSWGLNLKGQTLTSVYNLNPPSLIHCLLLIASVDCLGMGTYFISQSNLVKPLSVIDVKVGHPSLVSAMGKQVILVKRTSSYVISVNLHL